MPEPIRGISSHSHTTYQGILLHGCLTAHWATVDWSLAKKSGTLVSYYPSRQLASPVCHWPASGQCPSFGSCSSFPLPQFFARFSSVNHASTFPLESSGLQLWVELYFWLFTTVFSPWDFSHGKIRVAFSCGKPAATEPRYPTYAACWVF